MLLFFENSYGARRTIAAPETFREAVNEISRFLKAHDYESYYMRTWRNDEDEPEISEYMFDNELIETIIGDFLRDDNKYNYGGGYSHSTYDGTIADASERKRYGGGITAKITDENIIDYIDRSVSGETIYDEYTLTDDDGVIEVYPTEEAARSEAEELINSGAYNHLICYHDWYRETLDDTEFSDGKKVFEMDENGEIYEDAIEDEEEYV